MQINLNSTTQAPTCKQIDKADAKLKKTCQDFEAMMVSQMLGQMRQTVQKTDLFGSGEKEQIFQGMLDSEIAKNVSQNGSMGIGKMLYEQLSKQYKK